MLEKSGHFEWHRTLQMQTAVDPNLVVRYCPPTPIKQQALVLHMTSYEARIAAKCCPQYEVNWSH